MHAAAAGLGDGDREVIELALRHSLAAADMADVLGMPVNHVHARLSRARAGPGTAIGVLLVARAGSRDCPTLAAFLGDWDGRLTPLLRKRIGRHLDSRHVFGPPQPPGSPAALLAAYVAGPFLLAAGILREPDALRPVSHSVPLDAQTGFPKRTSSLPQPAPRRRVLAGAAAVLALLALGAATVFVLATGSRSGPPAGRSGEALPMVPEQAPQASDRSLGARDTVRLRWRSFGGGGAGRHGGLGDSGQPGGPGGPGGPGWARWPGWAGWAVDLG